MLEFLEFLVLTETDKRYTKFSARITLMYYGTPPVVDKVVECYMRVYYTQGVYKTRRSIENHI
jgi:hypothetical protein